MDFIKRDIFDTDFVVDKCSNFLADYLKQTGAKGYVIGLSGGVDSTAAAALAVNAVGEDNVYGLMLPCSPPNDISRKSDIEDAADVVQHLHIKNKMINMYDEAISLHKKINNYSDENLILGNIKARLRMMALRAKAEELGYLVLGTTNRPEDVLGYFTKGGDGGSGVDVEPMQQLYKWEVRGIVNHFGFNDKLVNRIPTAGLWTGQTDEKELGFSYNIIDWTLMSKIDSTLVDLTQSNIESFIDNVTMNLEALGVGPLKTDTDKFFDEVAQFIINKYNKSAHKRNSAPFTNLSNE